MGVVVGVEAIIVAVRIVIAPVSIIGRIVDRTIEAGVILALPSPVSAPAGDIEGNIGSPRDARRLLKLATGYA